ncbi:MAG: hypothetical protein RLZZ301_73 [Bacteroidota bacterium]|jgi:pimeloyl-ACP methyl ester carboxylesterase
MLAYSVKGEGPSWVFLHGFLESSTMWDYLPLDALPIRQIRIDLPGHGQSHSYLGKPSIKAMADAVAEVVAHLQLDQFCVLGHSMGAYVGLELAQIANCQHLILLNSNCWSDSEQKKQDRLRVAQLVHYAKDIFIREAIPNLFHDASRSRQEINQLIEEAKLMSPEAIAHSAFSMRERSDFTAIVTAHPQKYSFIHGIYDRLVSVEELQQKVTNNTIYLLDCGHMAHIEASEKVMEIFSHERR